MANLFDEIDKELAARSGSKNGNIIYRPNGKIDWYAMAKGSGANNTVEEANDTIGNGFLGHVVDSAQAGAAGSVGGFARFLEEFAPFGNEWMGELANDMDKVVRRNTPLQPLEGTDWVASALGNAIGSGIPSIVAGAAIIGAAGAVGAAVPASIAAGVVRARTAIPALGKIVTATKEMWKSPFGKLALTETAGSAFEGTTEAGNLITEMRDKGYTDEEIRQAAIASASMNTAWLTVANAIGGAITAKYGKEAVKGGLKQMAKNAGRGAVLEGSSEAAQEYGQSLIGNVAEGTELDHEAAKEAAAQAFVGSGILGGFGGAAAPYINNNTTNSQPNPNTVDEQEKLDDSGVEDAVTETDTTINPDLEQARNEIIGYRETFNEDDAEFGRLTELLENGNDEEIIAEAQAIRGVKPDEQVETSEEVVTPIETLEEEQTGENELADEVVEQDVQQPTSPVNQEQQETGGEENGETNLPPEGQNVKTPENTGDNGQPQEDVTTPPENQQDSEQEVASSDAFLKPKTKATIDSFKKKLTTEVRTSLETQVGAVTHYQNYLNKYYVKKKILSNDQAKQLVEDFSNELKEATKTPLTADEKTQVLNNLKNLQTNDMVSIKQGKTNSRMTTTKFREKLKSSGLSDAEQHKLMVDYQASLNGVLDALRKAQAKKKNSDVASVKIAEDIQNRINNLDEMFRKGVKVEGKTIWGIRQEIGKNEDRGTLTKEQAEYYLDQLDKVIDDKDRAEINATGGKPEKQEVSNEQPKGGKKTEPPKQATNPPQQQTEPKPNKFAVVKDDKGKKELKDKLMQDTKRQLEDLEAKVDVDTDLDAEEEKIVAPYNVAIAKKQLTPEDVNAVKARVAERFNKMRATQNAQKQVVINEQKEDSSTEKPNKFVVVKKPQNDETNSDKGNKAEEKPPKGDKENQVRIIEAEDTDTEEIKGAKKKLYEGISKALKKIGIQVTTRSKDLVDALNKGEKKYKDIEIAKDGAVWVTDLNNNRFIIKGYAIPSKKWIYISPHKLNPQAAVHEYTHIWNAVIREFDPVLWQKGVALAKKSSAWNRVKAANPHLKTDDKIADEVIALWAGEIFDTKVKKSFEESGIGSTIKQWIKKYWKAIKEFFNLNSEQTQNLSFADFGLLPIQSLFNETNIDHLANMAKQHANAVKYDALFKTKLNHFYSTKEGKNLKGSFTDKDIKKLKEVFTAFGNGEEVKLKEDHFGRDKKYYIQIGENPMTAVLHRVILATQYFSKNYQNITEADIEDFDTTKAKEAIAGRNLVTEFIRDMPTVANRYGGAEKTEELLRSKFENISLHKYAQKAHAEDFGTDEEDGWNALYDKLVKGGVSDKALNLLFDYYLYHKGVKSNDNEGSAFGGSKIQFDEAIETAGIPVNGTSRTLYQAAYHGSPHIFDEFSVEHIGSSEGAQAHGWGLYFAQDELTAKIRYRDRLLKRQPNGIIETDIGVFKEVLDPDTYEIKWAKNGKMLDEKNIEEHALLKALSALHFAEADEKKALSDIEGQYQDYVAAHTGEAFEKLGVVSQEYVIDYVASLSRAKSLLQEGAFGNVTVKQNKGAIFEVEIPDNDVLLDEDLPFDEQPLYVQNKLREIYFEMGLALDDYARETPPSYQEIKDAYDDSPFEKFDGYEKLLEELAETIKEIYDFPFEPHYYVEDIFNDGLQDYVLNKFAMAMGEKIGVINDEDVDTGALEFIASEMNKLLRETLTGEKSEKFSVLTSSYGEEILGTIESQMAGSKAQRAKAASLLLNKHGIKGITYDGEYDGRCFVIFDDAAIEIKRRYETAIQKHKEEMTKVVERNDKELRQGLPNGKFERLENGDYIVTMPNGARIQASTSGQIIVNAKEKAKAKSSHNLKGDDVIIRGSWTKITSAMCDGLLKLSDSAKRGTAFHEVFHAVWDLALSQKEKDALLKHFQPIADRKGVDVYEVMADAFAAWMRKRAIEKAGTRFNKLWQKILDQAKRLQAWFTGVENIHNVMRRIETGEVWNQPMNTTTETTATRYSASENQDSLLARGTKAVVTKKPKSVSDDIKANGYKGFAKQMFRKFYRSWVDKNIDIKDFDAILSNALGRALTAAESVYNKVQMVSSNAAGLTTALINGNADHISAANSKLDRKKMKYKVTLATVLDMVNAKVMQPYEDYLKASGCDNWIEAFGAYLGWRRLAEMARLKRLAFNEEHAEWAARKRAYDAWANSGRIGKNPLLEEYEAWEAYQKNLKNAKRRWERAGKVGVNPVEALKAEWLATHKNEEAPKRFVGKEPVFEEYKMPQGLTEQEVNQLIKQAPAPFAKAAKHYYMLNDNILSIMEDAGLIDAKTHELLNEKYKDYCPMIRDFSDTAAVDAFIESITTGGKGVGNVSSMLKKISEEGSERTIINPLESTIQTIAAVSNRAERNKAGQHLVRMMSKAEELKGYIRKLEQPKHGSIQADPKNCIFTIMFNGKKVAYQADPEYYNAIVGYNMPTSSLLLRVPQTFAQCLRTGATMSPSFIVRNVFRDTITAGIASKNGFIPIIDTIRGAKALWSDPEFRAKFEASGVVAFNQFGRAESAYNNLTDLASGKNYTVYEPVDIIKGVLQAVFKGNLKEALKTTGISLEQLSSYAESATRAGEFKKALEAGKSINEASYDAKEVTLNFSRSGILGQEWNRVVPFFNACIQGGDKLMRLFYEDPKATSLKVAQYIVLPSLALWALNHDEDWYEELDPQIKYTHWCLPNGIRVPKPQEYGILFGGSIEAMLDAAVLKDPKAMIEVAKGIRDTVTPSVMPTIVLPLIEWITNYSFFKGRDLVPQRLQRMPDELQYSTGTSELSKFVGKHTYFSPIKIDNVVRGYTGTMGTFLWQTPDWFAAEKQGLPAKEVSEMQFIRDFNVTEANRTRFLNDFYELQDKANKQQAGYGVKGKPNGAVKAIRKAGKIINDLNKQIRTIEMSDKYTPERKRELIDKKRERINSTAKFVVKKYGELF